MLLTGRQIITSAQPVITGDNVVNTLKDVWPLYSHNRMEIDYLYEYYKGRQPVLTREKTVRSDIKNCVVENHAYAIVSFFSGYVFGDPIQYVRRAAVTTEDNDGVFARELTKLVSQVNEYMFAEDKASKDKALGDWMLICGMGYRGILPDKALALVEDESPFEIATLDPRNTFVVHSHRFGSKPLMAVQVIDIKNENGDSHRVVWTPTEYFEIIGNEIVDKQVNPLGFIPIVEYSLNNDRMGAFEHVIPLLNAINTIQSNRVDGVEQFVQSLLKFVNVDVTRSMLDELVELGAISIMSEPMLPADVDILTNELNQDQTQTLMDHLLAQVLMLCGVPDRGVSKRSTTGDTGQAVMLRDGWSDAETKAKSIELMFKKSEKVFLRVALHILRQLRGIDLKLSDIDIKFTRNRTDNLLVKTQGLQNMLEAGIAPQIAISICGLFSDSEQVYLDSEEYLKKWEYAERPAPFQQGAVAKAELDMKSGGIK